MGGDRGDSFAVYINYGNFMICRVHLFKREKSGNDKKTSVPDLTKADYCGIMLPVNVFSEVTLNTNRQCGGMADTLDLKSVDPF